MQSNPFDGEEEEGEEEEPLEGEDEEEAAARKITPKVRRQLRGAA